MGVKFVDVDTLVLNVDTSDRVVETRAAADPGRSGSPAASYLGRHFSVEGEVSGLTLGDRGHVWEMFGAARAAPERTTSPPPGGYRKLALEGRDDRDYLKIDLGTWTFGAEISL